ncbi:PREDICTED: protein smg8-like [Papilio polytes]|uniref:protein smg8-like n=1 Tax=Papilio polytes TaxID=76194 RepID=UPI000675D0BE|nr:PREDICTED: protein smg8-like [Papilio polytes]
MNEFSIHDIPEFSKKERIVVVGIIGKSPYRYHNKTTPLLPTTKCEENGIQCFWDERKSVLYLHAITYLDTKRLATLAADLDEDSKCSVKDADAAHWLVAAGELAIESCRAMTLIFHLCHIIILSLPTPVFDLGYLQLFEAIDGYRNELHLQTKAALSEAEVGSTWENHGRPCCPRLLFHFRRAPTPLRKAPAALKRLEHAVEDQLYFMLRKTRIITNVCAKSVFAIPKNEEFVYINTEEETGSARDVSSLVRGLVQMCNGTEPDPPSDRPSFRQFLQGHIDLAFGEGFDDNVGKYAMSTSFFELPSASSWRRAAQVLTPIYLQTDKSDDEKESGGVLFDTLATDVRFSQARCAKVLPIAQASYTEGLPPYYSSQQHAHKVSVALGELEAMARGPLMEPEQTEQANAWRASRGRGKATPQHHLTVKIFIGFEYECTRGHRFMMSSPEGPPSSVSSGSWAREAAAGARLAHAALPLQTACLCRAAPRAHLARVHVVTPKSNVHVTLNPKVQPIPGGAVFVAQPVQEPPFKLSSGFVPKGFEESGVQGGGMGHISILEIMGKKV